MVATAIPNTSYIHQKHITLTMRSVAQLVRPGGHQFEFHNSQNHWTLTWLLTLGPVRSVEVHASWFGHPH